MKKLIYFLSLVSVQVSSVLGQGLEYVDAVNRTVNPSGLQEIQVLYEMMGGQIAAAVFVPVLVLLVYGRFAGLWDRNEYWQVVIAVCLVAIFSVVLFPIQFSVF